jgi:hypothetical protein
LVGKPEGKRPLVRPRNRWEDNINMYLNEMVWEGVDWMRMAQDEDRWLALTEKELKLCVLYKAGKFSTE